VRLTRDDLYDRVFFFRGNYRPRRVVRRTFTGLVAFADALALLGLFLYAQSAFVLQPGVRVNLPTAPFTDGAAYGSMVVVVSQEGFVFFNDERIPLEGLASAFRQSAHDQENSTLLIEADAKVRQDTLVEIYNMAAEAGIRDVVLASRLLPPAGGSL
jgi:biopolymer transport protein ExbD